MFRPMRPVIIRRPLGAPLLRGAIVGGAAYGMGRRSARDARQDASQDRAIADLEARNGPSHAPPAPQAAPAAAGGEQLTGELAKLGEMVRQGLLTPEEFAAAKAKLLAS
jgi:hypothetical protein